MTTFQWIISIVIAIAFSGTMGAILTLLFQRHQEKRQPIECQIEVIRIFDRSKDFPGLEAHFTIPQDSETGIDRPQSIQRLDKFAVARITLRNTGNQDIPRFHFGITLQGSDKAVDQKFETPDRHHIGEALTPVSLFDQQTELDYSLKPFNRNDKYKLNVFLTFDAFPSEPKLSTAHSTQFVQTKELARYGEAVRHTFFVVASCTILAAAIVLIGSRKVETNRLDQLKSLNDAIDRWEARRVQELSSPSPTPQPTK